MRNLSISALVLFTACVDLDAPSVQPLPPDSPDPISAALPALIAPSPSEDPSPTVIALLSSTGPLVAWDFGTLQVGGLSPALVLTVVNNTSTVSDVLQISFTGSGANQFTLADGDCVGQIQLAPGASCSVRPRFAPTASGAKTASLSINGGVAGSTSILLSGTGAPQAILSTQPAAFSFSVIEFGHPATETFTLVNSGVSVVIQSIAIGGSISNGAFSVASTTCTGTLAASASCTVAVQFNPSAFGQDYGNLTVMTDHGAFRIGDWVDGWGGARLTVQATGNGSVYSDGGGYPADIDCGVFVDDFDNGTSCTGLFITPAHALAASGNLLAWGGACSGSTASCLVTLSTTATVVTASFAP